MVAEAWGLFEEAVAEAGPGDLPNILRSLKATLAKPPRTPAVTVKVEGPATEMMPPPATPPPATPPRDTTVMEQAGSRATTPLATTPVLFKFKKEEGGKVTYKYGCPVPACEHPVMASKYGMDAHIREKHTFEPHLCAFCNFTSFNLDSVMRHERKQHHKTE